MQEPKIPALDLHFELSDRDRALMAAAVKQEWFAILQRIMEEEIRAMNFNLINASSQRDVLAAHNVVKGASSFYSGVINRLELLTRIEDAKALGIGTPENPERTATSEEFE
jgi:hypothetical protein